MRACRLPYREHTSVLTIRHEDLILDYESVTRRICNFLGEDFPEEMLDGHSNAQIHHSKNLVGGDVGNIRTSSLRKFEQPDFNQHHFIKPLLEDPMGRELLEGRIIMQTYR